MICCRDCRANRCLRFQWIRKHQICKHLHEYEIIPYSNVSTLGAFSKPWHRRAHLDDHKAIPGNIDTLNMEELHALCRRFNIEISGGHRRNRLCSHPKQLKIGKRKQINTKMSQGSSRTQGKIKEREGLDWLDENKENHTNLTQASVQFSQPISYSGWLAITFLGHSSIEKWWCDQIMLISIIHSNFCTELESNIINDHYLLNLGLMRYFVIQ